MTTSNDRNNKDSQRYERLQAIMRAMPPATPPVGLTDRVMRTVEKRANESIFDFFEPLWRVLRVMAPAAVMVALVVVVFSLFQRPIEHKAPVMPRQTSSYTTTEQFLLGDSDVTDERMLENVLSAQDDDL